MPASPVREQRRREAARQLAALLREGPARTGALARQVKQAAEQVDAAELQLRAAHQAHREAWQCWCSAGAAAEVLEARLQAIIDAAMPAQVRQWIEALELGAEHQGVLERAELQGAAAEQLAALARSDITDAALVQRARQVFERAGAGVPT